MIKSIIIQLKHKQSLINELIKSKELYNACNFLLRQQYFKLQDKKVSSDLTDLQKNIMDNIVFNVNYPLKTEYVNQIKSYCGIKLHAKVTQSLINQLAKDWKSFFTLKKKGLKCTIPNYKQTYNNLYFNKQTFSQPKLKKGILKTYLFEVKLPKFITANNIQSAMVKINAHNVIDLIVNYNSDVLDKRKDGVVSAIDFGLKQIMTVTFDDTYRPLSYNGKLVVSLNRFYNKMIAKTQSNCNKKLMHKYFQKRNLKMKHLMHRLSNVFIQDMLERNVAVIVLGKNRGWKNNLSLGSKNNQKFYAIPFNILQNMIKYKAESLGIEVIEQEESYTSKSSFLDGDEIPVYGEDFSVSFSGKRTTRGLYETRSGYKIHADVNGSYNILVKSKQSDNGKLGRVRDWLCRGCLVVQPIGKTIGFN